MKKLIALLLAVTFICASTVGCGDTKSTGGGAKGGASGGGSSGGSSGGK